MSSSLTEMPCVLCGKPVNLGCDLFADENGQAVHEECYIKRIKSDATSLAKSRSLGCVEEGGDTFFGIMQPAKGGTSLKTFLITFLVSTVASICLWQFGLGNTIWPAHPFPATLAAAVTCGIAIQLLFSHNSASQRSAARTKAADSQTQPPTNHAR
jgi:hypothetical protein